MVKGWFELIPLDPWTYGFYGVKNRIVYYYAVCEECGNYWGKDDANGYVPTDNEAFCNYNSCCIGELKDFSKVDLSDNDASIELTGY